MLKVGKYMYYTARFNISNCHSRPTGKSAQSDRRWDQRSARRCQPAAGQKCPSPATEPSPWIDSKHFAWILLYQKEGKHWAQSHHCTTVAGTGQIKACPRGYWKGYRSAEDVRSNRWFLISSLIMVFFPPTASMRPSIRLSFRTPTWSGISRILRALPRICWTDKRILRYQRISIWNPLWKRSMPWRSASEASLKHSEF